MDTKQIATSVARNIDTSPHSRAEVARLVHMDETALSKSINGTRSFKTLELSWIADLLGMSVDELIGRPVPNYMAAARATTSADAHVAKEIQEIARLMVERRSALNRLDIGARPSLPKFHSRASERDVAEVLVERIREVAGSFVLTDVDELCGAIEEAFGIDVWVRPLPAGIDGYAVHDEAGGVCAIIANSEKPAQRIRFTICHELVHLVLRDDTLNAPHSMEYWDDSPIEQRAHQIASLVLMPRDKVPSKDEWTRSLIAMEAVRFRVAPSAFAARVRSPLRGTDLPSLGEAWSATDGLAETYTQWGERNERERKPARLLLDLAHAYTRKETTVKPFALVAGIEDVEEARAAARELVA